jgi:hypothetical protein
VGAPFYLANVSAWVAGNVLRRGTGHVGARRRPRGVAASSTETVMDRDVGASSDGRDRAWVCDGVADGARCQLRAAHPAPHARVADGSILTWTGGEVHRWSLYKPRRWLLELDWRPGFGPPVDAHR